MKSPNTEWNLKLLYKGDSDPRIEKDMKAIEKAFTAFEKKYKNKDFVSSTPKLLGALKDFEKLEETAESGRPARYLHLRLAVDSNNKVAEALYNKIQQRLTEAFNKVTFFKLALSKIPASRQKQFLQDKNLSRYRYALEKIFLKGKYFLSEGEERLASLLSQPSQTMWRHGHAKILNRKTVEFKGKSIPITEASAILADQPKKERRDLQDKINQAYKSISEFTESEINAICTAKKIMDEQRGFKNSYTATVMSYENDELTVESLAKSVTRLFPISHRFYKLHAKLLGEKKIANADKNVKLGKINRKFDFHSSVKLVERSLAKIGSKYADIPHAYVENRQIDVFPRTGKRGGAFCSSAGLDHVFIMLNHADNIRSLETIAHEVGHGIHSEMSKSQPAHYRDYTIAVAEVASTFFEQALLNDLEQELTPKEYVTLLHNKIAGDIATIFRQIACFNFEKELHETIRRAGGISKEDMANLMNKHMQSYLGPAVELTQDDGYAYVGWPHIRMFFYTYTYAYGQLISRALFERWKADPSYIKKIDQFLSAGGSMSPKDIFKSIGIDTSDPKFFESGLRAIEKDINKLEKLSKEQKS